MLLACCWIAIVAADALNRILGNRISHIHLEKGQFLMKEVRLLDEVFNGLLRKRAKKCLTGNKAVVDCSRTKLHSMRVNEVS